MKFSPFEVKLFIFAISLGIGLITIKVRGLFAKFSFLIGVALYWLSYQAKYDHLYFTYQIPRALACSLIYFWVRPKIEAGPTRKLLVGTLLYLVLNIDERVWFTLENTFYSLF